MVPIFVEELPERIDNVEIVECKGKGHPDTLCDILCDLCSNELSKYYLRHFGAVLHHNIDKGMIVAGAAAPKFGGGKITKPMRIIIAGRATAKVGKKKIPVKQIVTRTVKDYMKRFRSAKFEVITEIKEGAGNLKEVFRKEVQVANDTSVGVSHYPYTQTEQLVLDTVKLLESDEFRKKFPMAGADLKVMALRVKSHTHLTIALAFIDKLVKGIDDYREMKHAVREYIEEKTGTKVFINTLDSYQNESSIYLTVSGLSAEMGDDGQVGRGNRCNGLITPNKPMSIEATAGKNISHPGKIYQVMAHRIAKELVEMGFVRKAEVKLLTQIGKPLDNPQLVAIAAEGCEGKEAAIRDLVNKCFSGLEKVQKEIIEGRGI